jgi:hypothetical protein
MRNANSVPAQSVLLNFLLAVSTLGCGVQTRDDCILKFVSKAESDHRADILLTACEAKYADPPLAEHGETLRQDALAKLKSVFYEEGENISGEVYNGTTFPLVALTVRVTSERSDLDRAYRLRPEYGPAGPLASHNWTVRADLPPLPFQSPPTPLIGTLEPAYYFLDGRPGPNEMVYTGGEGPRLRYDFELVSVERER